MKKRKLYLILVVCLLVSIPFFCITSYAAGNDDSVNPIYDNVYELISNIKTVDDIESNGYSKISIAPKKTDLNIGDLMLDKDNNIYVYIKQDDIIWWKIREDGIEEINDDVYDKKNTFYYYIKEDPVLIDVGTIITNYGKKLNDVTLPNGYTWVNANTSLKKIGTFEYDAVYTPDNTLKYNVMDIKITVDVQKIKTAVSQVPVAKYEVLYYPETKLSSIGLPDGWHWMDEDVELDVGSVTYRAAVDNPDQYNDSSATEMDITVVVKKNTFKIDGITITVNEGSKLSNSILPGLSEGKLVWDKKDEVVEKNCTKTCHFTPDDKDHYKTTKDINVLINVVPKVTLKDDKKTVSKTDKSKKTDTTNSEKKDTTKETTTSTGGKVTVNKVDFGVTSSTTKTEQPTNNKQSTQAVQTTNEKIQEKGSANINSVTTKADNVEANEKLSVSSGTTSDNDTNKVSESVSSTEKSEKVLPNIDLTQATVNNSNKEENVNKKSLPTITLKSSASGDDVYTPDDTFENTTESVSPTETTTEEATVTEEDREDQTTEDTTEKKEAKKKVTKEKGKKKTDFMSVIETLILIFAAVYFAITIIKKRKNNKK